MPLRMWEKYIVRETISYISGGYFYDGSTILGMFLGIADRQLDIKIAQHLLSLFSDKIIFIIDNISNLVGIFRCDCYISCSGKHSIHVRMTELIENYLSQCNYEFKNGQWCKKWICRNAYKWSSKYPKYFPEQFILHIYIHRILRASWNCRNHFGTIIFGIFISMIQLYFKCSFLPLIIMPMKKSRNI